MTGRNTNCPRKAAVLLAVTCILASVAYAAETPLTNGVPLAGQSGTAGSEKFYRIDVPAGQDALEILTTGGTGDVDLYVRRARCPRPPATIIGPTRSATRKLFPSTNPTAGTWYVMLRGYADYAGVTVKATYSAAVTIVTLANGVPVTGLSGAAASEKFFKIDVPAGQLKLEISMSGGTGDADLYVKKDAMPTTTLLRLPALPDWQRRVRDGHQSGRRLMVHHGQGLRRLQRSDPRGQPTAAASARSCRTACPSPPSPARRTARRSIRIQVPAGQTNLEIAALGRHGRCGPVCQIRLTPDDNRLRLSALPGRY